VAPVLALPGWYVDRKGRGDVLVFSGRELRKHLLRARTAQPIAAEQVQRIVHQVEQRCRNVQPGFRLEMNANG
jgi:transcriptional regulator NrdR family protein